MAKSLKLKKNNDELKELEYTTNYRIVRKLAQGGMGAVYLAEQLGTHGFKKVVAIKTVRREKLDSDRALTMFISEAKLVADLIHENITQVYNLCERKSTIFIVMEYIKGITLSKFLAKHRERERPIDCEMAAFLISRVARALAYAHNKTDHDGVPLNIVHRDVTPANVMIDTLGVVKLTDFGIAKASSMGTPDEKKVLMGKYPYMSPEQVTMKGTDGRSDIYSLGIVLYELLTMKKLFPAQTREELLDMLKSTEIPSPSMINPDVKPELSRIVMSMLKQEVKERVPTARKVVLMLERYMYEKGYGPTNEKLALYLRDLFNRK